MIKATGAGIEVLTKGIRSSPLPSRTAGWIMTGMAGKFREMTKQFLDENLKSSFHGASDRPGSLDGTLSRVLLLHNPKGSPVVRMSQGPPASEEQP